MAVVLYLTEIFDKAETGIDPGLQATLVCLVQVFKSKRLYLQLHIGNLFTSVQIVTSWAHCKGALSCFFCVRPPIWPTKQTAGAAANQKHEFYFMKFFAKEM